MSHGNAMLKRLQSDSLNSSQSNPLIEDQIIDAFHTMHMQTTVIVTLSNNCIDNN